MEELPEEDAGDSKEERAFSSAWAPPAATAAVAALTRRAGRAVWINSLHIRDVFVSNLFEAVQDGVLLLRVIDAVYPGVVDWRKVNLYVPAPPTPVSGAAAGAHS